MLRYWADELLPALEKLPFEIELRLVGRAEKSSMVVNAGQRASAGPGPCKGIRIASPTGAPLQLIRWPAASQSEAQSPATDLTTDSVRPPTPMDRSSPKEPRCPTPPFVT